MSKKSQLICFQNLWSIAVGHSSMQDPIIIEKEILDSVDSLKLGLDYFKQYSERSIESVKKEESVTENVLKFLSRASKLLNVDGKQALELYRNFSSSYFRGSKAKLKQMLSEEKSSVCLLSEFSNYYFIERLYLLRTLGQIIGFFQDIRHQFQEVYAEAMQHLVNVIVVLEKQFENSISSDVILVHTKNTDKTPEIEMRSRLALQRVKEQCELLELIFLHYAQFGMNTEKLIKFTKLFKKYDFGNDHPFHESVNSELLAPLLECMNSLQQVILIEGLDMHLLQDPEEHNLFKNKEDFQQLDTILVSLVDQQSLSPLTISWATIRYLLLEKRGGLATQKMGEKAIAYKVWQQLMQLLNTYPFNTKSNVTITARKMVKDVLSRVTTTFHEETLGDYADLISLAVLVMKDTNESGIHNSGLGALLLSASGFFPLYVDPMISLLSSMVRTKDDAIQVHAFMANLPLFSEFIATCTRDEVESLEDASMWRLLASKPIRTAGGLHTTHLPEGTVGNLVDSQYGAMVQWQKSVNGWHVLNAELKNMLEYQGPSSNLELLGYIQKTELIYQLVENILRGVKRSVENEESAGMAVLETMEVFVAKFHRVIQRVVQSPSPPAKLIMHCLRCAVAWLRIRPEVNASVVLDQLWQINFLPTNEKIGFSSAALEQGNPSGLYGMVLLKSERTVGCFFVTVSTIELLTVLLDNALSEENFSMVSQLSRAVEFILTEVFASYQQWQRSHPETWDNIGIRCMEMCHSILSYSDSEEKSIDAVATLQRRVVEILSCSSVAKVLLKLACVDVITLHAVMANEPTSLPVLRLSKTIKLGFSLLNNLLRIEASLISRTELEERSYLHRVLATPTADDTNLVSVVASYLYHRHNIALPRLAVALLRRISLVAPMSLYACLGSDVAATRDILLFRLRSRSEDISLKIGILEFLVVTVQYQPGLLELFLDLSLSDKDKPEQGLKLGDSSCVKVVMEMIEPEKQGTFMLPPRLHCACVKLLNALWVDKRHSAIQALRSSSTNQGLGFWSSVLYPLFSENTPKDIAKNELLETCAHIFNIVAHDLFYTSKTVPDSALAKVLDEFKSKNRFEHWSKVLLCVTKTIVRAHSHERRRHQMFASAWKSFVVTSKITDLKLVDYIIDDVCSCISFLMKTEEDCPDAVTTLNLVSSLLLIIINNQIKSSASVLMDLHQYLPRIVQAIEAIHDTPELSRTFSHLQATAIILVDSLKELPEDTDVDENALADLTSTNCKVLTYLMRDLDPKNFQHNEQCLLLVRCLEVLFELDSDSLNDTWLHILSHESTLYLFRDVIVKCITSCRDGTDLVRLSMVIMRLLSGVALYEKSARKLYDTGLFPVLCLGLTNLYHSSTKKKWLEVYHTSLILMTRMIASLSHDFANDTLDFLGVHYERLLECFSALRWNPSSTLVQEAVLSTAFLTAVTRDFTPQWRFKLPRVYQESLRHILATTHVTVAMLLQPRLLQKTAKLRNQNSLSPKISTTSSIRSRSSRRSLSKTQEDEITDPEMSKIQQRLYIVLANCLEFIANLSPNLCQIMLDQGIDSGEYSQLLSINFASPTLDQEPIASFGVIISAANIALSTMHKMDMQDERQSTTHNTLNVLADSALITVMSQCMLLLKQPNISNRQKQILKRELSDELNSCVRSATRHLRHSSSSFSPHSSPIQLQAAQSSSNRSFSSTMSKGILELTNAFIKQLLS